MKKLYILLLLLSSVAICVQGCTGLSLIRSDVTFRNPYKQLDIVTVDSTSAEESGVLLRMLPSAGGMRTYREETKMYDFIKDEKGKKVNIKNDRQEIYLKGSRDDTYIIKYKTDYKQSSSKQEAEYEQTTSGEIVWFISGIHHSKQGKFKVLNWSRSALFPKENVQIGDSWKYEEVTTYELDSFWVKNKSPEKIVIEAKSTLVGFALVGDTRCAVIESVSVHNEHLHLRVLFKDIDLTIRAKIEEKMYLDYATGTVMAKVFTTLSHTQSSDGRIAGTGQGQSIIYLVSDELKKGLLSE